MKKIVLIGLKYDKNIGDYLIGYSLKYILEHKYSNNSYNYIDLKARKNYDDKMPFLTRFFLKISNTFGKKNISYFLKKLGFSLGLNKKIKKYLNSNIKNCDIIIFTGGGIIECEHYLCFHYIELITKYCEKNNIDIIYNAVGFNGQFNSKNRMYLSLAKSLQSKKVRMITVRENLSEIQKYGIKNAKLVCDPACHSSHAYGINRKESKLFGIGMIRHDIFEEFGYHVDKEQLLVLYYKILKFLENEGYEYEFFTNGVDKDSDFVRTLLQCYPDLKYHNLKIPNNGEDYLNILSNYNVILCSRMHASICSYSLNIPSINLAWNPKIKFFYENIGFLDRIFFPNEFDANIICNKLIELVDSNCENERRNDFMSSILSSFEENDILND